MMGKSVNIFRMTYGNFEQEKCHISNMEPGDICFYRFIGGNTSETEAFIDQLYTLKEQNVLLIGIFRFPFRFEGKKRLQTAVAQYYRMYELCDAAVYFNSDGMMNILEPGTTVRAANEIFNRLEETAVKGLEDMVGGSGEMNIDFKDIQTFIQAKTGPLFLHTFEGDSFDEPLTHVISSPHLPEDYAEGKRMIINIGYTQDVDMDSFRQINLRLHDLFHKADLFKLGTYFINEPGSRFKITLLVGGIEHPYPMPEDMSKLAPKSLWLKRKWDKMIQQTKDAKWMPSAIHNERILNLQNKMKKKDKVQN